MGMKAGRFVGTAVWKEIKDTLLGAAYKMPPQVPFILANGSGNAVA